MLHQSSQEIIHFTNYVSYKDVATPELKRCVRNKHLTSFSTLCFVLSPDFCVDFWVSCVTVYVVVPIKWWVAVKHVNDDASPLFFFFSFFNFFFVCNKTEWNDKKTKTLWIIFRGSKDGNVAWSRLKYLSNYLIDWHEMFKFPSWGFLLTLVVLWLSL